MAQLVDTSWSPSKTEHIVGTQQQQVAPDASEVLFAVVQRELAKFPGNNSDQKQVIKQRTLELSQLLEEFAANGVAERIPALEAELEQVVADGKAAEAALLQAKDNELVVTNAEAKRLERYDRATRNLNNAKNEALPDFHTNADVKRKFARITEAQIEVEAALDDMNAHPLSVPSAVQAKNAAAASLDQLQQKVRALRRELAALKGEDTHTTGQQRSNLGLAG